MRLTASEVPWLEDGGVTKPLPPISPLRRRMIEDMNVRRFGEKTQNDYIRYVKTFSTFLGRSPATATAEDVRRYQVHQSQEGLSPAIINSSVAALRFIFRVTLNHPEIGRHLTLVPLPVRLREMVSFRPAVSPWDRPRTSQSGSTRARRRSG